MLGVVVWCLIPDIENRKSKENCLERFILKTYERIPGTPVFFVLLFRSIHELICLVFGRTM